ncbi:SHOCT domain-containing protein [Azospirillum sp. B2RO_4]|uniref:SHOCT domain-containing protein n=1 Tax=Azospirillum sp. B2RO_4 TaxID=3027796 RepID=UPI003DA89936
MISPIMKIAFLSLSLSACVTDNYATGPIKMDSRTLACYIKYKNLPAPEYFAVAVNGSGCGYSYCPDVGNCGGNRIGMALDSCRAYAKTEKCVIYAYGGKPIFGGDDMPGVKADSPKPTPAQAAPGPSTVTLPSVQARGAEVRLRELQRLRDQGLITPAEFDEKRREILGGL